MLSGKATILALSAGVALGCGGFALFAPDPALVLVLDGSKYEISTEPSAQQADVTEAVRLRARQLLNHEVYLSDGLHSYPISAPDLGYSIDEAAAQKAITGQLKKGFARRSTLQRLVARLLDRPVVVRHDLQLTHDGSIAEPKLQTLTQLVDRPPTDAQLLIAEHEIVPSAVGRRMSVDASLVRLAHDLTPVDRTLELAIEEIPPTVTEEQLAPVDITRVLSAFETSFRGKAGARAVNIRTAGRYLNGAVILPGEVLSFNNYVGRRVHGRGFVDAPVIINDELEQDVGGGVCQVATTLHGAAVFGNVEIVYRRSHSRPSGYAPLGLDATVIDGKVDLKIRNPYEEPLLVFVSFPSEFIIRVELLGRDPEVKVKHDYSVTHSEPYARRIWHRPDQPEGTFEKKQKGIVGMDVVSVLRIEHPDGKIEKRRYRSKYYPVPEVFWLGDGATQAQLPDVSEEITRVVVDGEDVQSPLEGATAEETGEGVPSIDARPQVL